MTALGRRALWLYVIMSAALRGAVPWRSLPRLYWHADFRDQP